jgi:hypothetical protein
MEYSPSLIRKGFFFFILSFGATVTFAQNIQDIYVGDEFLEDPTGNENKTYYNN